MHPDEVQVDEHLLEALLQSQFPQFAGVPLRRVEPWGTDHAIFRLGDELVARLPRIAWAKGQPELEARWLPRIAPYLPVAVPEPIVLGEPGAGYPFPWAIHRWLDGEAAAPDTVKDPVGFASRLAEFVRALESIPTEGAPPATNRARPLRDYEDEALAAIGYAADLIDVAAAHAVWDEGMAASAYEGPAVWVQGDLEGNCLVTDGRLSGIVDWGSACAGDPAVDVQVVWSPLFTSESRQIFLRSLEVDPATVARGRAAAIHQACAALPYYLTSYPLMVERSRHKLTELGVALRDP